MKDIRNSQTFQYLKTSIYFENCNSEYLLAVVAIDVLGEH